jgi:hypothetical protein
MTISELGGFQRKEGRKLWASFRNSCWFQKWEDLKGRNEGRKEVVDFIHLQMYSFSIDFMYNNTFHQPHYELESNFCTLEYTPLSIAEELATTQLILLYSSILFNLFLWGL